LGGNSRGPTKRLVGAAIPFMIMVLCPLILPVYWILVLTEVLIMGLFAMSFNLLLGFTGLLSFGQAGFFGAGAYVTAIMIAKGSTSVWLAFGASTLVAGALAVAIGYLCVRRDEIYFAMITLAFGMMLYTVAHNWIEVTGGSDGLPLLSVPELTVLGLRISLLAPRNMYLLALGVTSLGTWCLWRLARSPFGLMLTAVRENRERLAFVGGGVMRVRLAAFVIAGALAGLSGSLFCLFNAMATPTFLHWSFSARPVLMTILGGSSVFFGPAVGAAVFFGLEQVITQLTHNWMIVLGAILVPVVLFFPRGVLGTVLDLLSKRGGGRG
jgi:branched-chain amino acid transport system permease protein